MTRLRVAEEAGVGRATMYRHWPTVEDLRTDVLVDCQEPWGAGEPTGDLRADLIAELDVFVQGLQHSKLPEIIVAAMERAPADPRIRAMHESMTQISRDPVWTETGPVSLRPGISQHAATSSALQDARVLWVAQLTLSASASSSLRVTCPA